MRANLPELPFIPNFVPKNGTVAKGCRKHRISWADDKIVPNLELYAEQLTWASLGHGDCPTPRLRGLAHLAVMVEALTRAEVAEARNYGMSWSEIGEQLGISKQAAQQRYGVKTG